MKIVSVFWLMLLGTVIADPELEISYAEKEVVAGTWLVVSKDKNGDLHPIRLLEFKDDSVVIETAVETGAVTKVEWEYNGAMMGIRMSRAGKFEINYYLFLDFTDLVPLKTVEKFRGKKVPQGFLFSNRTLGVFTAEVKENSVEPNESLSFLSS